MKKAINNNWYLLIFLFGVLALLVQCQKEDLVPTQTTTNTTTGAGKGNQNTLQTQINDLPVETLSQAEESGLLFMREEEKLAHDVYRKLYEAWGLNVFNNIANSEATHTETVRVLLEKYELPDPVGNNEPGVFTNPVLQNLYDSLTTAGLENELIALNVGSAIEEIDILDLETQLTQIVDNQDILLAYENLQKGSRNHLRAFVKNLKNRGVIYEPQYLSNDVYQAIIDGEMETGG